MAEAKEYGMSVSDISNILSNCPVTALEKIKWTKSIDVENIKNNLNIIARDVLEGKENSLCKLRKQVLQVD